MAMRKHYPQAPPPGSEVEPAKKRHTRQRRMEITPEQLAMYAGVFCTISEVAAILKCTHGAIQAMLKKPEFKQAWDHARETTRYQLRKAQIDAALVNKDKTALIWLGKQMLDQRDSPKVVEQKTEMQITYIAKWGGWDGQTLEAGEEHDTIEGEVAEDGA